MLCKHLLKSGKLCKACSLSKKESERRRLIKAKIAGGGIQ